MNLSQQLNDAILDDSGREGNNRAMRSECGFDDLGIAPDLLMAVNRLKFSSPTPVQHESIPAGLQGKDIVAIAQTGSGKTLAYGIPMFQRLSKTKRGTGLILVPTRELAIQVEEALASLGHSMNMRSIVLIGGASIAVQRNALKKRPRIIVATPGRLMDLMSRRTVNLDNVAVFVLDEADRMLDMGFIPDIKKIMKSIPANRQTMLFSATMPKEIEAIAEKLMTDPVHVETDRSGATPAEVSHEMFVIKNQDKSRLLALKIAKCSGPVLVFTRTKRMAKKLAGRVKDMGFATAEIHSNRSLLQRQKALDGFKRGKYQVLIATDIAARGIDVTGIELVVNYDMPANSEDYVHRIGRTGRAGKTGHAVSFATIAQKGAIRSIERFMKTTLAISTIPTLPSEGYLLRAAAQRSQDTESSTDRRPPRRSIPGNRPPKRRTFRKSGPEVFAPKRKDSKRNNSAQIASKQTDPRQTDSKQTDPKQTDSKSTNTKWTDSKRTVSKRKKSKAKNSKLRSSKPKNSRAQRIRTKAKSLKGGVRRQSARTGGAGK